VKLWRDWIGLARRDSAGDTILLIAREVTDRQKSVQGGLAEIREPRILDRLTADDFEGFAQVIDEQDVEDHEYAIVLARLVYATARAKGFDDAIVDAALQLDSLLPGDDPSRERDRLLRDAYAVAQRSGYVAGGRAALNRLGIRALEAGESERARQLLGQQLELGDEEDDMQAEVSAALALGDLLRREGDRRGAYALFRRAGRAAQRLDDHHGIAEALARQIELMPANTDLETLAAVQRQASDAARRTADLGLQSRIVLSLSETLQRNGKRDEAVAQLEHGLEIAREIGDLALAKKCLAALADAERDRGRLAAAAEHERSLVRLEERLGNRAAAGDWATRLGATLLTLERPAEAVEAYGRALELATAGKDAKLEQRALGGLGVSYAAAGRSNDALQHLMRALDLAKRAGDQRQEARWLASIGQTLWRFNHPEEAIRALHDAASLARRADDAELQANALAELGRIYASRKQTPRARESFSRALELNRRLGNTPEQIALLSSLATLAIDAGQIAGAMALCDQALQLATVSGDRASAARLHGRMGRIAARRGEHRQAVDHLRQSLGLARDAGDERLIAQALQHLATAQHAAGDPEAIATYRGAIEHCRGLGDRSCEALMAVNLGILLGEMGRRDDAVAALRHGAGLAARMGPQGRELAERAEAAIDAAREAEMAERITPAPTHDVARDNPDGGKDALFRETTLPPA
jgi:tetratricopeptide (TPR) repeat protein